MYNISDNKRFDLRYS